MAKKAKFDNVLNNAVRQKRDTEAAIKKKIKIKEELKDFIPPLSPEEFARLEENILLEGCRDALILWKEGNNYILVDGHNRLRICQHHQLDFKIEVKDFPDLPAVQEWMIINQLGKRNLSENAKSYLRGKQYGQEKQQGKRSDLTSGQNVQKLETREKLAKEYKVSAKTIQRDEKYALAIDRLAQQDNQLRWQILNKDIDLSKESVIELLNKESQEVEQFRDFLLEGTLQKALEILETAAVPQKTSTSKENARKSKADQALDEFRTEFLRAFKKLSQEKDRDALSQIKELISKLEKTLFK
ncbi:MAG: hypothetical protein AAFU64_02825 [Bacteroidota bacterium]